MKRLLLALLLCLLALPALAEALPEMSVGFTGPEVLEVKRRLYALGYFKTDEFTKQYTENTAEKISLFQQANDLAVTGVLDADTAARLFSEEARHAPRPTMRPLATPAPLPEPDWPERDEEGYLAEAGEYVYENDEAGLWVYLSPELQIKIVHRQDDTVPLEWFETDIRARGDAAFRAVATNPQRPGRDFRYPYEIARQQGFVLGFSDDFYGNRMGNGETVGIIIRDKQILSEKTNKKNGHHLPNLDMMAQYPDGTLAVYRCNEITAQQLVEQGAVNVFSFGPILLRDGEINDLVYDYYKSIEPRHALGMIEPGHYFLLSVQGRIKGSDGTTLQHMAEMMRDRGVQQALNLDGGNTMALVFRGRMLNKLAVYKNKKFVRQVTSLIGIGYTEEMGD